MPGTARAFHIESPAGNLSAIYTRPPAGVAHIADMVFVHGFGHELYNARPVMAYVWRRLAQSGAGVLAVDLPGCGDSAGDFGDARWPQWLDAIYRAHDWLQQSSERPISVCGLRLGAALALESERRVEWDRMVLLQPAIRGEDMMTQFLRLRVAFSGLRGVPAERETTQSIRSAMAAGTKLEVAGYTIDPELVRAIDGVDLSTFRPRTNCPIHWLETTAMEAAARVSAGWGPSVALTHVDVKPYWSHTRGEAMEYDALARAICGVFGEPGA
jgi:exosortase A-associated hydrolase 2